MLVSSQNSYVEILTLKMMAFGSRAFGRGLGHEGGATMNGIRHPGAFALCPWEDTKNQEQDTLTKVLTRQ